MKKVLITGANGFIAKHIARCLKDAGCFVIGTSRYVQSIEFIDKVVSGILGEPLKDVFTDHQIDVLIHCAYDKQDIDNEKNAEGTILWAEQAEKESVGLQIFMSSLSATEEAVSPYGLKKFEVEKWFIEHNQVVFRLGLVIGNGGLFGTIISMIRKSPLVPLVDMGKNITYVSGIGTVSSVARDFAVNSNKAGRGRVFFLQQKAPVLFSDVLKEIRKQYELRCIFIPIPYFLFSFILALTEKLEFFKLEINANNLKEMRQFNNKEFATDLPSLGYSDLSLDLLIKKTIN